MKFSENQQTSEKKITKEDEMDFISDLPNDILYIILSLLSTKNAVATSALSRRWLNLWKVAFLPHLDFNDALTLTYEYPPNTNLDYDEETLFVNFVGNVLRGVNLASVKTFSLSCLGSYGSKRIFTWIGIACMHNIVELDVCVHFDKDPIRLPPRVYTCNSLVVLKLNANVKLDLDLYNVCFASLKVLHIFVYNQEDNDLTKRLYSRCPVLEDLFLAAEVQSTERQVAFYVCSSTLKRLRIELYLTDTFSCVNFYDVMVRAENLEWLDVCDDFLAEYCFENLHVLDRAKIDIGHSSLSYSAQDVTLQYANRAFELLEGLSHVKSLSLSGCTVYALSYVNVSKLKCRDGDDGSDEFFDNIEDRLEPYGHLPTFNCLTNLKLGLREYCSWTILPNILQCSPNLEILTLKKEIPDRFKFYLDNWPWKAPESLPTCMLNCLKEIDIKGFEGKLYELTVVEFLLRNAQVLQRMDICSPPLSPDEEKKLHRTILEYPRSSEACQLKISSSS